MFMGGSSVSIDFSLPPQGLLYGEGLRDVRGLEMYEVLEVYGVAFLDRVRLTFTRKLLVYGRSPSTRPY